MKFLYPPRSIFVFNNIVFMLLFILLNTNVHAQGTVTGGYTPAQMANKLTGPGVSVFNATMSCPGNAYGQFVAFASTLGLDSGIILTSGTAATTTSAVGVNITNTDTAGALSNAASTSNASSSTGGAGDADLTALAGQVTYDACILEFDFKPTGDTVNFKYVFGSEEYTNYTCTVYNDVFGFFITGGAYTSATNIAKVPGTNIPVCINSVNCGATGSGTISNCTALGSGSPFCTFYVANGAGTTITYDGMTVPLTATVVVTSCDTYHLKLGVADAFDDILDSGVFIEAGSLTSNSSVNVTATGISGVPYCVRGCAPATFTFSRSSADDSAVTIRYTIAGTATNGYDYSTIATSAIIPAYATSTSISINPLIVAATGPKTVILTILIEDRCNPGVFTPGPVATVTILDSFSIQILTPDTSVCNGQVVNARALGDPLFLGALSYTWAPAATVSNSTSLNPVLSPTVTTTYTLSATAAAFTGCPAQTRTLTVNVYTPSFDSVTFTDPTVCGYADGSMTLHGLDIGYLDTLNYTFNGIPQPPMPVGVSSARTILVTGLVAGVYSDIWVKVGLCPTLRRGPVTLVDPPPPVVTVDSNYVKTCVGVPVALHAYVSPSGVPVSYTWTPPAYLSNSTISNPIVNPSVAGDITYTITVNPGTNPGCATFDTIHVHTLDPYLLINNDTPICLGRFVQGVINGSADYNYVWTPSTGVSDVNIQNPAFAPVVSTEYVVTATYANCPAQVDSFYIEVDTMATPLNIVDTICLGMTDSINVRVPGPGTGSNYYHYQWIPPADISNDTAAHTGITPIVTGTHTYSVIVRPNALNCSVTDIINLFVLPNSISVMPHDTAICMGKVVQVVGQGDPLFHYQWIPTAGISVSNTLNTLIVPDTSATYIVTARFGRCPDMTDSVHLWVQPNPRVYIGGNRLMCEFDTLHIHAFVNPAWYDSFSYAWSPAAGLDFTTTQSVVYSGTTTTDIYLTVSTPAGCKSDDSARITVYPGNFLSISPDHIEFCPHDTASLPLTNISGTSLAYQWFPARYLDDNTSGAPVISPIGTQVYTIVGTTANGCKDTVQFTATVFPAALISVPDSVTLYPGESFQIEPLTNCTSFAWFPLSGLSSSNISNPVATPEVSTRYTVFGVTADGCKTSDSIDVFVNPESVLAIPNAFMPGTGVNKDYKIIKKGIATLNYFRIFNRWGNLLFETTNIESGWDGTYNGQPQPFGVYVYEVQAVTTTGRIFSKRGNVTLIR
ncbi:MAG: choice-of-anchor L domain-containing protein [Taibaiella sp.]|nr:choice-of-anchor L domain-containing protein [Taibaiella sp.]